MQEAKANYVGPDFSDIVILRNFDGSNPFLIHARRNPWSALRLASVDKKHSDLQNNQQIIIKSRHMIIN